MKLLTRRSKQLRRYKSGFIFQKDQSDCGVACLLSIINYHGGTSRLEYLREISGTTKHGTTMLGLYQAAQKIGFDIEGLETGMEYLKNMQEPCILHTIKNNRLQHYIIVYDFDGKNFIVGDPGEGVRKMPENELNDIWKSKALLKLTPNDSFEKKETIKSQKKHWLLRLLKEDMNLLIVIFFLGIVTSVLSLALPVFSQKLIDNILPNKNIEKLIIGVVLIGFILMSRNVLSYLMSRFVVTQGRDFNNRLINFFFNSLLFLPKSFFDNRKTGELVARMNDTRRIQETIIQIVGDILRNALLAIISCVIIFLYSSTLGLVLLGAFPLYFLAAYIYHNSIVSKQREVMTANALKTGNYVNSLEGIDTIKVANKESQYAQLNKRIYGTFQQKVYILGKLGINVQLLSDIIEVSISLTILVLSSFMVFSDQLMIGEVMAVLFITRNALPAIGNLAFANVRLQGARIAFDRMYEFTALRPEFQHSENSFKLQDVNIITIQNLSFRFPGRKKLLDSISLTLQKGKIVTLLGESGGGKSTFCNILQKFYKYEIGKIFVDRKELSNVNTPSWRSLLSTVPQDVQLFNGNLIDNISLNYSDQETTNKVLQFCRKYGFESYFMQFPQNYGTILGEEGVNISGGQKQLVALARALYHSPQVLILDEPTSAMDRNTENFVLNLLQNLKSEMIIFIVSHRIKLAHYSDYIYILENGKISAQGTQQELLNYDNLYSLSYRELVDI
jgi:ATP-binding cassette subfamily B protein